ncbi:MAG: hypothetical protein PHI31_09815 [Desulfuromonadaceae bacterium]|nr:hypothetical protein [Desulfuromonadaceae bacterium]
MGGSASGGSSSSESSSKPLTAAERAEIFRGGIADIASYAPQYFTAVPGKSTTIDNPDYNGGGSYIDNGEGQYWQSNNQPKTITTSTPSGYTMNGPSYQTPDYVAPTPASKAAFTSPGSAVQAGPAQQAAFTSAGPASLATGADAGAFQRAEIIDPGEALRLAGGDYDRLEQNLITSRMSPLQQAIARQYEMTDQEMADRGIYASGIGAQSKNRTFARDYLPQINAATAEAIAQRYGLESGDNNATNGFNLSRASNLTSANLTQSAAENAFNTAAAERANAIALANAAATNQMNQFNAAGQNTNAATNAAAVNQGRQFDAAATNGFTLDAANSANTFNLADSAQNNQFNLAEAEAANKAKQIAAQTQYDAQWRPLDYAAGIWNGTGGQTSSSSSFGMNMGGGFTI